MKILDLTSGLSHDSDTNRHSAGPTRTPHASRGAGLDRVRDQLVDQVLLHTEHVTLIGRSEREWSMGRGS